MLERYSPPSSKDPEEYERHGRFPMQIHRITYFLFALVLVTAILAFATRSVTQTKPLSKPQQDSLSIAQESRLHFPSADYEEREPVDPVKRALRKEKQKRYDNFHTVAKKPHPGDAEVAAILDDFGPPLPALPLAKSSVIIVGVVLDAQAHLSDNKKNVYSEFTVRLDEVLKTQTSLPPDNLITLDRQGGFVKYPNGQKVLYRFSGERMPRVGKRYVFFLEYVHSDYRILTAYELSENRVTPLDDLEQFKEFRGHDEAAFLSTLRDLLAKPVPPQE
ncbi:MAG: hypothetical protein M3R69_09830 [Acidobacteriota bacterium]|nr:hypothetical protein [Acidobacteriota bacterium]